MSLENTRRGLRVFARNAGLVSCDGFGTWRFVRSVPSVASTPEVFGWWILLLLGVKAAWKTFKGGSNAIFAPDTRPITSVIAWRRGVLVLLSNPKATLMWAAVVSFLFGHRLNASHVLAFGPMGVLSGLIIYETYACLFSTGIAMRGYSRFSRWFEGVFAATFGAMGASLIRAGVREAQK